MSIKLRDNLIAGVAVLLPLLLTIWVFSIIVKMVNTVLLEPVIGLMQAYLGSQYLELAAKTLIILVVVAFVYVIGLGTRILFVRKFFSLGESLFYRVPMVGKIYTGIKEIISAFYGKGKGIFQYAVLVEYPRKGLYSIGFAVKPASGEVHEKIGRKVISVFIATAPNPTSGFVIFVPEDDVIRLDMSVEDAMKLVISGGAVMPKR